MLNKIRHVDEPYLAQVLKLRSFNFYTKSVGFVAVHTD